MVKTCRGSVVDYSVWDLVEDPIQWYCVSDVQCSASRTVFQPYSVSSSVGLFQWDLSVGRLEWCLPNTANWCFLHLVRLVVGYFVRSLTVWCRASSLIFQPFL